MPMIFPFGTVSHFWRGNDDKIEVTCWKMLGKCWSWLEISICLRNTSMHASTLDVIVYCVHTSVQLIEPKGEGVVAEGKTG